MDTAPPIPRIKICGITSKHEAELAIKCGADAVGLLMLDAKYDKIEIERAAEIASAVGDRATLVMVTHETDPIILAETLKKIPNLRTVQLHSEAMTMDQCIELRRILGTSYSIIRAVSSTHDTSSEALKANIDYWEKGRFDALILDARYVQRNGTYDRTPHNWDIAANVIENTSIPILLAGGLNADNIAEAISTVSPYGVDVHTGVEREDGEKDPLKIRSFCYSAARNLNMARTNNVERQ